MAPDGGVMNRSVTNANTDIFTVDVFSLLSLRFALCVFFSPNA